MTTSSPDDPQLVVKALRGEEARAAIRRLRQSHGSELLNEKEFFLAGFNAVRVTTDRVTADHVTVVTTRGIRPARSGRTRGVDGLVRVALALLDPTDRERYTEEWAADLLDQDGRLQQAGFALGVMYSAARFALRRAFSWVSG